MDAVKRPALIPLCLVFAACSEAASDAALPTLEAVADTKSEPVAQRSETDHAIEIDLHREDSDRKDSGRKDSGREAFAGSSGLSGHIVEDGGELFLVSGTRRLALPEGLLDASEVGVGDAVSMRVRTDVQYADAFHVIDAINPTNVFDFRIRYVAEEFHPYPACTRETVTNIPAGYDAFEMEPGYVIYTLEKTFICQPAHDGYHWAECNLEEGASLYYQTPGDTVKLTAVEPSNWIHYHRYDIACAPGIKYR